ncbi:GNAT family N-acetyltransferase [Cronobacter dublinensis]|uniref:WeoB n=1 Tax=Cronobacter dublinensis subsp. dublinensis LMG 23823 TaxID=1159554 RepID=M9NGJ8_9ENTR|nr:GNAT family N-acetyltransferase [Cronobacter dublinensis]AFI81948.1 WeoB [Cronobacter dublinensis subsp. dublinensis LMG 23823]ALB67377.1 GNAT family acetyltransferase [Cronobacter dublinensis subsp. dublinensis LMG 23823]MDI7270561.1 GNAT family N-acetyltransferase [Cronobacter dublinensis]MDI7503128.1 GNAT family N-acetyltransferase [Cronobacter dublinensis]MDT3605702.1 GNAT family N-acetyltransferase [Cronobacter dublinensis]
MDNLTLTTYDRDFLELSWTWLQDPEIKKLTLTSDFSRQDQENFFNNLSHREDYIIYGVNLGSRKIGVAGLKNIKENDAEYWGYIGEKDLWGKGLGKYLISALEDVAKNKGIKKLYLKVSDLNVRAIKAYQKSGFVINDHECDIIIMEKMI